ncbi:putative Dynein heavy chain [Blattamonas nauphoetae]|uniref:Dynein heavy chain n=1 Tax=Blattamonas nauphoetae TaxID=2049346 RepID=A0ABQ9YAB3_9EUKA|nr:putative Dynein heavy chain [Blattamonas nauphoetae]
MEQFLMLTIRSSSFIGCSAQVGGSVTLSGTSSLSISDSVFHHSRTTTRSPHSAHAVDLLSNDLVSLCNVLFVDCSRPHSESEMSCAVRLADSSEFVLDSVMFRGADSSEGKDVVFQNTGCSSLLATKITNCDSTTGAKNCLIVDEDRLDSTLIPHPQQEATISGISCNRVDERTATLQMLTESAVEGRMIALVDILDGSTTPNDDSHHPFHRLVIFDFPELGTQSAPTTVCLDEWDERKFGRKFRLIEASMPNKTIIVCGTSSPNESTSPATQQGSSQTGLGQNHLLNRMVDNASKYKPNYFVVDSLNKEKTILTVTLHGERFSVNIVAVTLHGERFSVNIVAVTLHGERFSVNIVAVTLHGERFSVNIVAVTLHGERFSVNIVAVTLHGERFSVNIVAVTLHGERFSVNIVAVTLHGERFSVNIVAVTLHGERFSVNIVAVTLHGERFSVNIVAVTLHGERFSVNIVAVTLHGERFSVNIVAVTLHGERFSVNIVAVTLHGERFSVNIVAVTLHGERFSVNIVAVTLHGERFSVNIVAVTLHGERFSVNIVAVTLHGERFSVNIVAVTLHGERFSVNIVAVTLHGERFSVNIVAVTLHGERFSVNIVAVTLHGERFSVNIVAVTLHGERFSVNIVAVTLHGERFSVNIVAVTLHGERFSVNIVAVTLHGERFSVNIVAVTLHGERFSVNIVAVTLHGERFSVNIVAVTLHGERFSVNIVAVTLHGERFSVNIVAVTLHGERFSVNIVAVTLHGERFSVNIVAVTLHGERFSVNIVAVTLHGERFSVNIVAVTLHGERFSVNIVAVTLHGERFSVNIVAVTLHGERFSVNIVAVTLHGERFSVNIVAVTLHGERFSVNIVAVTLHGERFSVNIVAVTLHGERFSVNIVAVTLHGERFSVNIVAVTLHGERFSVNIVAVTLHGERFSVNIVAVTLHGERFSVNIVAVTLHGERFSVNIVAVTLHGERFSVNIVAVTLHGERFSVNIVAVTLHGERFSVNIVAVTLHGERFSVNIVAVTLHGERFSVNIVAVTLHGERFSVNIVAVTLHGERFSVNIVAVTLHGERFSVNIVAVTLHGERFSVNIVAVTLHGERFSVNIVAVTLHGERFSVNIVAVTLHGERFSVNIVAVTLHGERFSVNIVAVTLHGERFSVNIVAVTLHGERFSVNIVAVTLHGERFSVNIVAVTLHGERFSVNIVAVTLHGERFSVNIVAVTLHGERFSVNIVAVTLHGERFSVNIVAVTLHGERFSVNIVAVTLHGERFSVNIVAVTLHGERFSVNIVAVTLHGERFSVNIVAVTLHGERFSVNIVAVTLHGERFSVNIVAVTLHGERFSVNIVAVTLHGERFSVNIVAVTLHGERFSVNIVAVTLHGERFSVNIVAVTLHGERFSVNIVAVTLHGERFSVNIVAVTLHGERFSVNIVAVTLHGERFSVNIVAVTLHGERFSVNIVAVTLHGERFSVNIVAVTLHGERFSVNIVAVTLHGERFSVNIVAVTLHGERFSVNIVAVTLHGERFSVNIVAVTLHGERFSVNIVAVTLHGERFSVNIVAVTLHGERFSVNIVAVTLHGERFSVNIVAVTLHGERFSVNIVAVTLHGERFSVNIVAVTLHGERFSVNIVAVTLHGERFSVNIVAVTLHGERFSVNIVAVTLHGERFSVNIVAVTLHGERFSVNIVAVTLHGERFSVNIVAVTLHGERFSVNIVAVTLHGERFSVNIVAVTLHGERFSVNIVAVTLHGERFSVNIVAVTLHGERFSVNIVAVTLHGERFSVNIVAVTLHGERFSVNIVAVTLHGERFSVNIVAVTLHGERFSVNIVAVTLHGERFSVNIVAVTLHGERFSVNIVAVTLHGERFSVNIVAVTLHGERFSVNIVAVTLHGERFSVNIVAVTLHGERFSVNIVAVTLHGERFSVNIVAVTLHGERFSVNIVAVTLHGERFSVNIVAVTLHGERFSVNIVAVTLHGERFSVNIVAVTLHGERFSVNIVAVTLHGERFSVNIVAVTLHGERFSVNIVAVTLHGERFSVNIVAVTLHGERFSVNIVAVTLHGERFSVNIVAVTLHGERFSVNIVAVTLHGERFSVNIVAVTLHGERFSVNIVAVTLHGERFSVNIVAVTLHGERFSVNIVAVTLHGERFSVNIVAVTLHGERFSVNIVAVTLHGERFSVNIVAVTLHGERFSVNIVAVTLHGERFSVNIVAVTLHGERFSVNIVAVTLHGERFSVNIVAVTLHGERFSVNIVAVTLHGERFSVNIVAVTLHGERFSVNIVAVTLHGERFSVNIVAVTLHGERFSVNIVAVTLHGERFSVNIVAVTLHGERFSVNIVAVTLHGERFSVNIVAVTLHGERFSVNIVAVTLHGERFSVNIVAVTLHGERFSVNIVAVTLHGERFSVNIVAVTLHGERFSVNIVAVTLHGERFSVNIVAVTLHGERFSVNIVAVTLHGERFSVNIVAVTLHGERFSVNIVAVTLHGERFSVNIVAVTLHGERFSVNIVAVTLHGERFSVNIVAVTLHGERFSVNIVAVTLHGERFSVNIVAVTLHGERFSVNIVAVTLHGERFSVNIVAVTLHGERFSVNIVAVTLHGERFSVNIVAVTLHGERFSVNIVAVTLHGERFSVNIVAVTLHGERFSVNIVAVTLHGERFSVNIVAVTLHGERFSVNIVAVTLHGERFSVNIVAVTVKNIETNESFPSVVFYYSPTTLRLTFSVAAERSSNSLIFGQMYYLESISDGTTTEKDLIPISFGVPYAPIVTKISSTLSSNFTHFQLSLTGTYIPSTGTFTAIPSVGSTFSVSFSDHVGVSDWVKGGGVGEMDFNTTYSLSSLVNTVGEHIVLKAKTFTTPSIPTLTHVSAKFSESDPNNLTLVLTGHRMPFGTFDLVVKESGQEDNITLSVSVGTDGTSGSGDVEVYNKTGTLEYGKTYSVVSLSNSLLFVRIPSSISFTTPSAPARIERVGTVSLSKNKTEVTVTLFGEGFSTRFHTIKVGGYEGEHDVHETTVNLVSQTELTFTFKAAVKRSRNVLEYGFGAPLVESITTSLSANCTHFQLIMKGTLLAFQTVYQGTLETGQSFSVSFSIQGFAYSEYLELGQSGLLFGTEYSIDTLIGPDDYHIVPVQKTFRTPDAPTLNSVTAELKEGDANNVVLSLTGAQLMNGTFTLVVMESGKEDTVSCSVSIETDSTIGTGEVEVYNKTGTLEYGKTYSVVSLSTSSIFVDIPLSISFTTPSTPARIESVGTVSLNKLKTEVSVSLIGVALSGQPFSVTVEMDGVIITSTQTITFVSETEVTIVFPTGLLESSSTLQYGQTYTLRSVQNDTGSFIVNPSLTVIVPNAPVVDVISSTLSSNFTHFRLTLTGTNLPSTGTFTATPSVGSTFSVSFSDKVGESDWVKGGGTEPMQFNKTYSLSSLVNSAGEPIVLKATSFTTPLNPLLISITVGFIVGDLNNISFALSGQRMPLGTFDLNVSEEGQSTIISFPVSIHSSTHATAKVEVYNKTGTLEYGKTYIVKSFSTSDLSISIPSAISFTTQPAPSRIEGVHSITLNPERTEATISLFGIALSEQPFSVVLERNSIEITSPSTIKFVSQTEVTVVFPTGLTEGPSTLEFGQTYTLKSIKNDADSFIVNPLITVSIDTSPIVRSISTTLSENCTHFRLIFEGTNLPKSVVCEATLKTGQSFDVTFSVDGVGESEFLLGGTSGVLLFSTDYSVDTLIAPDQSHIVLKEKTFRTPDVPTLNSVSAELKEGDPNSVVLSLTGIRLETGQFTLDVKESGKENTVSCYVSIGADTTSGSGEVEVYNKTGTLEYGKTYSVVSLSNSSIFVDIPLSISFTTPSAPARIERVGTVSLNEEKTEVTVPLVGVSLFNQPFLVTVERLGQVIISTQTIVFVSETEVTIVFAAGLSESTSNLQFGQTYTLKSVQNVTDSFIVNPSLTVTVPTPPIVTAISSLLSQNCTHFRLTLTGTNLPSTGTFTATPSIGSTFSVSFSSEVGMSDWMKGGGVGEMDFNTTYSLSSLVDADGEHIVLQASSFKTPLNPLLETVSADLKVGDPNSLTLTLTGQRMPLGTFDLIVKESGQEDTITLSVSVGTDPTRGSGEEEVYKKSGTLEYRKTYTVESFSTPDLSISIPSAISFTTPPAPSRIEGARSITLNPERTEATISLVGIALSEQPFSVVLERNSIEITSPSTIKFVSQTEVTVVFPTGLTEDSSTLEFGRTYNLLSIGNYSDSFIVNPLITISIDTSPIVRSISSSLSENCTHLRLIFEGTNLPSSVVYEATLKTGQSFDVSFSSSEVGVSSFEMGKPSSVLKFSTEYSVDTLIAPDQSHVVLKEKTFRTLDVPTLNSVSADLKEGTPNCVILSLIGLRLKTGQFDLKVMNQATSAIISISGSFDTSTSGSGEVEVYNQTGTLEYSKTYSVVSLSNSSIFVDIPLSISFTTPSAPARIERVGTVSLNKLKTEVTVPLVGVALSAKPFSVFLARNGENFTSPSTITPVSPTEVSIVFPTGLEENSSTLEYGLIYTLKSVCDSSHSFVVNPSLTVTIPNPPIVNSITPSPSHNFTHFRLTLTGTNLPSTGTFTATPSIGSTFSVSFSSEVGVSDWVKGGGTEPMQFNTTYSLSSLIDADGVLIVLKVKSFTTPEGPTLTEVSAKLKVGDPNSLTLTLTGHRMPLGTFDLIVKESGQEDAITLSVSVGTDSTSGRGEVKVYNQTGTLEYGKTYSVEEMKNENVVIALLDVAPFDTPEPPARIEKVECELGGEDMKDAILTVKGTSLPKGKKINIKMKEVVGEVIAGSDIELDWTWEGSDVITSGTVNIPIYHAVVKTVEYGRRYQLTSLSIADAVSVLNPNVGFDVPAEPARVETAIPALNSLRTKVIVELGGRAFQNGQYSMTLKDVAAGPFSSTATENGRISFEISVGSSPDSTLIFDGSYIIDEVKLGNENVFVNHPVSFRIPSPPLVKEVSIHPNTINSSLGIELRGTDLKMDGTYVVLLSPPFTFEVVFNHSTTATSSPLILGRQNSLLPNTTYTFDSITRIDNSDDAILTTNGLSLTTPLPPTSVVLWVKKEGGDANEFCGEVTHPCPSVDLAWSVGQILSSSQITLEIVHSADLTTPILISSGMSVLFSNGSNTEPTLTIPSSASMGEEKGMIVVERGILTLDDVAVVIEKGNPDFVLIFGENAKILVKDGSVRGTSGTAARNEENVGSLCSWESGIFVLSNSNTTMVSERFTHISQGAVNMKGGTLEVQGSIFADNSPTIASFPSLRRNIHCSDDGSIEIGSLSGGDGSKDHPSAWISADNCSMSGSDSHTEAPFFIPTLDDAKSTVEHASDVFSVNIVGETLIPCGLGLEVDEWDETTNTTHNSSVIDIISLTPTLSTETALSFSIDVSNLNSKLNTSFEWHARLAFGNSQSTPNHVVLKKSEASIRKALSLERTKKTLPWLIPLVVVLILVYVLVVVVLVCKNRRKKQQEHLNQKKKQEMDDEVDQIDEKDEHANNVEFLVIPGKDGNLQFGINQPDTNNIHQHNVTTTIGSELIDGTPNERGCPESTQRTNQMNMREVLRCDGGKMNSVTVNSVDTLFNRLHKQRDRQLDTNTLFNSIVRGLAQISKQHSHLPILPRLSPHWIFLDSQDKPLFQLNELHPIQDEAHKPSPQPTTSFFRESFLASLNDSSIVSADPFSQGVLSSDHASFIPDSQNTSQNKMAEEQRWMSPEVADKKGDIDPHKASVFSLGLILWEMETGLVPFGEVDAVNAQRQLGSGTLPPMETWTNESKSELVRSCLSLDPKERPSLDEILFLTTTEQEFQKPTISIPLTTQYNC